MSPDPFDNAPNETMIPRIVPSKPIKGVVDPNVPKTGNPCSSDLTPFSRQLSISHLDQNRLSFSFQIA
jgi:hypothetical protein